jgi:hypothetical protein
MTVVIAVVAGALIGLSLGALGAGGSILAVPVLVHLLGQSAAQATTGSLVVVATTSMVAAAAAHRGGHVLLGRGLAFGVVGIGGAAVGARAAAQVPSYVLLAAFSLLLVVVAGVMVVRQVRLRRTGTPRHVDRPALDDPILTFTPTFACQCPRALKVLVTATAVGLLTGFLGVGGGFLVVPALVLGLSLPMEYAAGTSLVAITVTSLAALVVRTGAGVPPEWGPVLALTAASVVAAVAGARFAARADTARLQAAFTVVLLAFAGYTSSQALPDLLATA